MDGRGATLHNHPPQVIALPNHADVTFRYLRDDSWLGSDRSEEAVVEQLCAEKLRKGSLQSISTHELVQPMPALTRNGIQLRSFAESKRNGIGPQAVQLR